MRFLSALLSLPFLIVLVIFVVHNGSIAELNFWPFDLKISMPLSLLALIFFVLGAFLGTLFSIPYLWRGRRERRCLKKEISKLNKEKEKQTVPAPSLLMGGSSQAALPPYKEKKSGLRWPWKGKKT
ncbi:MAG TPA: hypothetical protein DD400_00970 [Rhodospirillaceae bacterium]|nr:hypothetical protein [Rhodospirillaceae bacterium]